MELEKRLTNPPSSFFLQDSSLLTREGVRHAFFDRSAVTDDNKATLQETARRALGVRRAVSVKQVHSARAVVVRQPSDLWAEGGVPPEADALVSSVADLLLCVYTADCAPILLLDGEARVCAALHAGWRGALGGILEETLRLMRTLGAREDRMEAVVGPTIGVASYPVREDFLARFLERDEENRRFFVRSEDLENKEDSEDLEDKKRWHFDLPAYVREGLLAEGVREVRALAGGIDTFVERRFFSHRRAMLEGEKERGRNLACIALEN